ADADTDRYWRASLSGWLVIPAAGLYLVTAQIVFDAPGAGLLAAWICQNRELRQGQTVQAPGAVDMLVTATALLTCAVGDTLQIGAQQSSGSPVDALAGADGTQCTIVRVR